MLSSQIAQSLKSYAHFSALGVEVALSHSLVDFFITASSHVHDVAFIIVYNAKCQESQQRRGANPGSV